MLRREREAPQMMAVLDFVLAEIRAGQPPTRAEIARKLGFRSPNAAECHLRALQRRGFIRLVPGIARGIQVSAP